MTDMTPGNANQCHFKYCHVSLYWFQHLQKCLTKCDLFNVRFNDQSFFSVVGVKGMSMFEE